MLVPIQCEYYALEGLTQLIATINLVRDHLNPDLAITGVSSRCSTGGPTCRPRSPPRSGGTCTRPCSRPSSRAASGCRRPRATALPIALYRPESKGAEAYRELAIESARRRATGTGMRCQRRAHADARTDPRGDGMTVRTDRSASALGRGLASLIPQRPDRSTAAIVEVPLARITPNPYQPRHRMDDDGARRARGEHPRARRAPAGARHRDPRRLPARRRRAPRARRPPRRPRAHPRARPPARGPRRSSRSPSSRTSSAPTSTRSTRRLAYRQLIDEFGLTQERVAERVGKARATVANTLRLLDLHPDVQAAIADGRLTEGHGRALGGLAGRRPGPRPRHGHRTGPVGPPDRGAGAAPARAAATRASQATAAAGSTPDLERVEEDLRQRLGTKVSLSRSRKGGRIVIEYYSDEELGGSTSA